jgi:fatty acid desaturase
MRGYSRPVAWAVFGGYLALILGSIWVGGQLMSMPVTVWSVLLMGATAVFIGTRLRGLQNIVHECCHATFSAHLGDNALIGRLCAALLLKSFRAYRDDHLSHHANNGDYETDEDFAAIRKFRLEDPLTPRTVLRHLATPLLGLHLTSYTGINLSGDDGRAFKVLKLGLLAAMASFLVIAPLSALIFVLVPLFYVLPTLNYWTDCFDHAGLVGAKDELRASRNVLAPTLVRLVFFPRNDSYHLVHHLFPQIPARYLDGAHETLCEDPSYANRSSAVRPVHRGLSDLYRLVFLRKWRRDARNRPY